MPRHLALLALSLSLASPSGAAPPPAYLWHEPEWFDGVEGSFAYWTGAAKPTGRWGVAGPGISAEWSQGGVLAQASFEDLTQYRNHLRPEPTRRMSRAKNGAPS